jgi:hypothetical protein
VLAALQAGTRRANAVAEETPVEGGTRSTYEFIKASPEQFESAQKPR